MPWTRLIAAPVLALALAVTAEAGLADGPDRERTTGGSAGDGGSLGDLTEGIGSLFGNGSNTTAIESLPPGKGYSHIADRRRLSLRLLHGYATGLAPQPVLANYANQVLRRLVDHAPVRNLPAKVYLMGSDRFSATALPCGAVAVDWGLLHRLASEDELAFVLAHELGHVVLQHHDADWFVEAQHFAVSSGEISQEAMDTLESDLGRTIDRDGKLAQALEYGRIAYRVSEGVLMPAWQREQEDEADRFGMDLMVRAGYNPSAVLRFFAKLDAWEKALASNKTDDPIASFVQRAGLSPDSVNHPEETLSSLLDSADELVIDMFGGDDHYPPGERAQALQAYYLEHYRNTKLERIRPLPWAEDGLGGRLAEIDRRYAHAQQSYQALVRPDLPSAEAAIRQAIAQPDFWNDGYLRLAFYELRMRQNRRDAARANLDYALEADKPGVQLFKARIRMAEQDGDLQHAVAVLDDARRRLDDPPALLPERIRLYPKVGRGNEVPPILVECRLKWRDMAEACADAAKRTRL